MRINFSYPTKEQIVKGVERLATVIKNCPAAIKR
jgi:DNA-binding transcriptional MocR family regulator